VSITRLDSLTTCEGATQPRLGALSTKSLTLCFEAEVKLNLYPATIILHLPCTFRSFTCYLECAAQLGRWWKVEIGAFSLVERSEWHVKEGTTDCD
jgi:hypothetical protein